MENNKKISQSTFFKVLITIAIILLSLFFIFGLIGRLVQVILKNQSKRVDKMMSKLIVAKVIKDEKHFKKVANYKSRIFFYKHSIAPILILLVALILYIISISIYTSSSGTYISMFYIFFKTIFPWEGQISYAFPLGIAGLDTLTAVTPFSSYPTYYVVLSLITISLFFIGLFYYLFEVQGYLARKYRIYKLSGSMFSKNLDEIDLTHFINTNNSTLFNNNDTPNLPIEVNSSKNTNNLPANQNIENK